tara:strand:- start:227 stop:469 length:243 start_codon:yes stop_codon:yes gene_type:complete
MEVEKDRNPWRRRRRNALTSLGIRKDKYIKEKREILGKLKNTKSKELKNLLEQIERKEAKDNAEILILDHKINMYSRKNK